MHSAVKSLPGLRLSEMSQKDCRNTRCTCVLSIGNILCLCLGTLMSGNLLAETCHRSCGLQGLFMVAGPVKGLFLV